MAGSSSISATALKNQNFLRLTGLASGLDTESMVKSLMKAERTKYDKLAQQKQLMEWKDSSNLEVNNLLKEFRDTYLSVLNSDTSVLSSALLANKVTADSSTSAVITANAAAFAGTHRINSITSLATGASVSSSAAVNNAEPGTTTLGSMALTNPLNFSSGAVSFSINGETFSFSSVYTLEDIVATVNSNQKANVSMAYSSLTGKFTITSKNLGSDSSIAIENISGNAFGDNSAFGIGTGTYSNGKDAVLDIDGVIVTKDTNSFTIDGITYSLKNTTNTAINFNVEQDIDSSVNKIKTFVKAYNTLVGKLQSKLDEVRDTDYQPLTDDQKSEMSETQIEKWEAKVKTGLLEDDSYISKLLTEMRTSFFTNVTGGGTSAVSMGFNTISYLTNGQITLDETKLRKALQNNPQQVAEVLSNVSYETDSSKKFKDSGVFARISDTINSYLDDYSGYRTDSKKAQYERLEDSMDLMADRLTEREERYWTQFTRMEQYLSQMNTQSQWLSQQFSGKGG